MSLLSNFLPLFLRGPRLLPLLRALRCITRASPVLRDSRCVLRLLVRLGDLPVAVDHLHQQPEGQAHQQHIHHDLRVERRGAPRGCGATTNKNNSDKRELFISCILPLHRFCLVYKAAETFFIVFNLFMLPINSQSI